MFAGGRRWLHIKTLLGRQLGSGIAQKTRLRRLRSALASVAPVLVPIVYVEWALWIGFMVIGLVSGLQADSTADWLTASAARDGIDPYSDLRDIDSHYGTGFQSPAREYVEGHEWLHPRTPGALLLLQPITHLQPKTVFDLLVFLSLVVLAYISIHLLPKATGWGWTSTLALGVLLIISGPVVRTMQFGAMSLIIALLIWWFWLGIRTGDSWLSGIPLGIAIVLKLFPALLLVPAVVFDRRRAALSTIAATLGLMSLGVVLFDLDIDQTISGILGAGEIWRELPSNASATSQIATMTGLSTLPAVTALSLALCLFVVWLRNLGGSIDLGVSLTLIAMLLISPLSWEANDVILLLPVALGLSGSRDVMSRAFAFGWLAIVILGYYALQNLELLDPVWAGRRSLFGRLTLLAGVGLATHRRVTVSGIPDRPGTVEFKRA